MGEVRDVDLQLFLDDAAGIAHAGLRMPTSDVDALHDGALLGRKNAKHLALLSLVAAADDDDVVVLFDLQLRHRHSTSGASETIFIKRRALSSRVTGPKMLVPIGSPWPMSHVDVLQLKRYAVPSSGVDTE